MTSIAVHHVPGSFSDRWIERAAELGVRCRIVDCLGNGIIGELESHQALLWHWSHASPADLLAARHVIRAAESMGLLAFPSSATCWSFDDKLGQKYQLEALGAPLAKTWCFYSMGEALAFVENAGLPLVFKLRRGAGSANVRLVRDRVTARRLVQQAFGSGFPATGGSLPDASRLLRRAQARGNLLGPALRLPRTLLVNWRKSRDLGRERGYVYFQEFLEGNDRDVRVTVIGDRAFAFARRVRPGDFRASGSGDIDYDQQAIDPACISIAFETARKLEAQSVAFDFAFDREKKPRILEVSYAYVAQAVRDCPGHWDRRMRFVSGQTWPQDAILEDLLAAAGRRGSTGVAL